LNKTFCIFLIGGLMEKLYIISTCLKCNKLHARFHFKGFYAGHRINEIRLNTNHFVVGECYLIKIKKPVVKQQVLYGICEKYKKLFN
jgi:hypothetical protein